MWHDLEHILSYARLEQLPRYGRRALRLAASRRDDFLNYLDEGEKERLIHIAKAVRGTNPIPAIFIHGVLPRSGTNFLADALSLHRDVYAHPGSLYEFPLLYVAPGAEALRQEFLFMFKRNKQSMGRYDLLAYLASGWLTALQKEVQQKRILLKSPHVQNIGLFRYVFPSDILLLCLRDGRDVAQSSQKTFGRWRFAGKSFGELAREWRYATEAILSFGPGGENAYPKAKVVYYEQLVRDPESTVGDILTHAHLDPEKYDFDALRTLPVRGSSEMASIESRGWAPQEKPKGFNPIGRWRTWSRYKRARFKAIAGDTLVRAGYEADLSW